MKETYNETKDFLNRLSLLLVYHNSKIIVFQKFPHRLWVNRIIQGFFVRGFHNLGTLAWLFLKGEGGLYVAGSWLYGILFGQAHWESYRNCHVSIQSRCCPIVQFPSRTKFTSSEPSSASEPLGRCWYRSHAACHFFAHACANFVSSGRFSITLLSLSYIYLIVRATI